MDPRSKTLTPKQQRDQIKAAKRRRRLRWLPALLLLGGALAAGCSVGMLYSFTGLPDVRQLQTYVPVQATQIYDENGNVIANLHEEENRTVVDLSQIPMTVQNAVVAKEDAHFYDHIGVDWRGVARAVMSGGKAGGGSTLTQQLARNLFLTQERSITRKVSEMWLAIQIERYYSKKQILAFYLNQVYWGHNAYGIEAAARNYFGKHTNELNLAEGSLLAGLLSSPEGFSPYKNPKGAKSQQAIVFRRLLETGLASSEEVENAKNTNLKYTGVTSFAYRYPYFTSYVIAQLNERYGPQQVLRGGLKVYTTIDPKAQEIAEELLPRHVARLKSKHVTQGALLSIDPRSGYIRAMVGGTNYKESQFNRATQAHRQPGSTFKPFVYLAAFNHGMTPGSVEIDEPLNYNGWEPKNYDHQYRGAMTLKSALEQSINTVAVKVADRVGIDRVITAARKSGIESPMQENLSLALGTSEVTPLELSSAYGTLATNGLYTPPIAIIRVEDSKGQILEETRPEPRTVYSPLAAYTLVTTMQGVILQGTGKAARIDRPVAGKTGTTSESRDAWFVGFIPQLVTTVWLGNDDFTPMKGVSGGAYCAPLWQRFMSRATVGMRVMNFQVPPGWTPPAESVPSAAPSVEEITPTEEASPSIEPSDQPMDTVTESAPIEEPSPSSVPEVAMPSVQPSPEPAIEEIPATGV